MGTFLLNKEIGTCPWNMLLEKSAFASPFQTPEFYNTINQIEGYKAQVFAYSADKQLKALAVLVLYKEKGLKSYFSRRAILYGGPVLNHISDEEFLQFIKGIETYFKRRVIYIEIRNFFNYNSFDRLFEKAGWSYLPYMNFQLNLKGKNKDSLLKKFKYNRRREINQSIKNDASYYQTVETSEVKEVYAILKDLYSERVKLPLPTFEFFKKQTENNIMVVFAVKHNGKIIGGAFCPYLKNRNIYTFYYCGIRNYHDKIFPTHLAVLAAMEYAIEKNIPHFDFMGAGLKDEVYGVRKYKKAFGGELVEHGRYLKVLSPFLYNLGKIGVKLLAKLK